MFRHLATYLIEKSWGKILGRVLLHHPPVHMEIPQINGITGRNPPQGGTAANTFYNSKPVFKENSSFQTDRLKLRQT